jgi:hypothetical protein
MPRIHRLIVGLLVLVPLAVSVASTVAHAEKRIALVIGNAGYQAGPLNTPANDAGLIAQTLQASGFGRPHDGGHRRRAAKQRDERAPLHSITSSARASSLSGTSRLSALAVLRLSTSSNLVDCTTGRSAGFSPLRMRPA